jgi:predicted enzyme related to lactoylglutathione lyase
MKLFFNILCRDESAQYAFYSSVLGLPEDTHARSPIYRALATPDFQFGFHAAAAYQLLGLTDRRPAAGEATPVVSYATLMLDSPSAVEAAAQAAIRAGGRIVKAPFATYYGQWQAVLADPEDNVFRVATDVLPPGVVAPPLPVL